MSRHPSQARLAIIVLLVIIAAVFIMNSDKAGRLPTGDWYATSRQAIIQADLMYRMASFWTQLSRQEPLPRSGQWQLRERAVAQYERESLSPKPNPVAMHRLGVIYGERGYAKQAQAMFTRAATLDEERAGLYFALAAIYGPQPRQGTATLQRLTGEEQWLRDMATVAYQRRVARNEAAAETAEQAAAQHTRLFGMQLLLLLGSYGVLGFIGVFIVLKAIIARGFYVWPPRPARPPVLVPWLPLDALEIVAILFFGMTAAGLLSGLLLDAKMMEKASPLLQVAVMGLQYVLFSGVGLFFIWRRIRARDERKLRILGLRAPKLLRLIGEGIGGYGVLVLLLGTLSYTSSGGQMPGLTSLAQTGERLIMASSSPASRVALFILVCLIAPLLEELIFRGFVYPGLRRGMTFMGAALASALLFALMHMNVEALASIGLIGVVLAVLYERTRSVVPCIVCHALNNTLVFFLLLMTR